MVKYSQNKRRPWEVFYKGRFSSAFSSEKKAEMEVKRSIELGDDARNFEIIRHDYGAERPKNPVPDERPTVERKCYHNLYPDIDADDTEIKICGEEACPWWEDNPCMFLKPPDGVVPDERPIVEQVCANVHCGKMFIPGHENHIYCSEACFCEGEGYVYEG